MRISEKYKINLPAFEGPLDLLLFLIRKNDLNVYDIPISFITEEYLKYLATLKELDIDLAGEFLAMAAELTLIKSRMLLPQQETEAEEEGEDPRAELARRLMEYQRFKTAGRLLTRRPMLGRDLFAAKRAAAGPSEPGEVALKGEIFQIVSAFSDVLKRIPKEMYHDVAVDRVSLTDRIYQIIDILNDKRTVLLTELLPDPLTRYDVVITFLSLLEMARLKMIRVHQEEGFGRLVIQKAMDILKPGENIELPDSEESWTAQN